MTRRQEREMLSGRTRSLGIVGHPIVRSLRLRTLDADFGVDEEAILSLMAGTRTVSGRPALFQGVRVRRTRAVGETSTEVIGDGLT